MGELIGLWCLYQLYWWIQYKISKVKRDKKRVREMVAQDLPGKPRYPIFSATASLCFAMAIDGSEEEERVGQDSTAVAPASKVATADISNGAYTGRGAYMDGPASFVDLEANMRPSSRGSRDGKESKIRRRDKERERLVDDAVDHLTPRTVADTETDKVKTVVLSNEDLHEANISDLSSTSGGESANGLDNKSEDADVVLSEESSGAYSAEGSYATEDSWGKEPSDDDDIVYSLSSDNSKDGMDDYSDVAKGTST